MPCAGQKALLDLFRAHLPAGELRERGGKVRRLLHGQKKRERHGSAVIARLDPALVSLDQQLYALEHRVRAFEQQHGKRLHPRLARIVKCVLRRLGVGARQPARTEQNPAEVARHDAHDVFDVFALEDVQHRLARRALRLAVVAVANGTVVQDEAPAIVARVVVFLFHLVDARAGLRLALHKENVADEARALFFKLALRALVWDKVLCHGFNVPFSGFSPTFLS